MWSWILMLEELDKRLQYVRYMVHLFKFCEYSTIVSIHVFPTRLLLSPLVIFVDLRQACLAEDARHSLAFAHERLAQLQHAALWLLKGEATKTVIIEDWWPIKYGEQDVLKHTMCIGTWERMLWCWSWWLKIWKILSGISPWPHVVPRIAMTSSGIDVLILYKVKREVLRDQARTEAHLVDIGPLALSTWCTWTTLEAEPLLRMLSTWPKTSSLIRVLRDKTTEIIGAMALMQDDFLRDPFPFWINPVTAYQEFLDEIDGFAVQLERNLERVGADRLPVIARYLNAAVECFHMMGQTLDDDWVKKMANVMAEASYRCRLFPNGPYARLPRGTPSRPSLAPWLEESTAYRLSHPVVDDSALDDAQDDSWQMSDPDEPSQPEDPWWLVQPPGMAPLFDWDSRAGVGHKCLAVDFRYEKMMLCVLFLWFHSTCFHCQGMGSAPSFIQSFTSFF